jgi:predicted unusual protein kinase regulating ubiquinone biosynthesis (AarF/ABC1/UbiB family)
VLSPGELKNRVNSLGPSFIKLAQVLATRADFFDDDYLEELKSLHDDIPPMNSVEMQEVLVESFPGEWPFSRFDREPIASASIGQVHYAILKEENVEVAVKFRRKGVAELVSADMKILGFFNTLFRPLFSGYTRNSIDTLILEFGEMIAKEVSMESELANLKSFSKSYADSSIVFPKPYEKYCSDSALVMSYERGIRFDDLDGMKSRGIDYMEVMEKLILFYTEQMLVKGYFHADPHPGNLLVRDKGTLVLLDFGMVKRIGNPARIAIIEMVKSAHEEDFDLYISSCKRLGVISYEAPQDKMTELAQRMFDIFNDDNLDAISMQELAFGVMASMRDFPFKLPQEAIYILRASAIIEGLGTNFIPNFNGIKDILPILQRNIPRALGIDKNIFELVRDEIPSIPLRVEQFGNAVQKISEDEMRVHLSDRQLEWLESRVESRVRYEKNSMLLIALSFFILLVDRSYMELSISLFALGSYRIIFR